MKNTTHLIQVLSKDFAFETNAVDHNLIRKL